MDHHQRNMNHPSSSSSATSPTTFVQADTHTFRELVQKLTGADDSLQEKLPITLPSRYISRSPHLTNNNDSVSVVGPRRSSFKLQERRQNMRKLEIKLGLASIGHHSSPSPRQVVSPVTPLGSETVFCNGRFPVSGTPSPAAAVEEEEKAIAEKGYYLHPSPLSTPRSSEPPELLPLFPLESPKQQQQQRPRDL